MVPKLYIAQEIRPKNNSSTTKLREKKNIGTKSVIVLQSTTKLLQLEECPIYFISLLIHWKIFKSETGATHQ